ncbi:MAG: DNA methyltransferase [Methanocorpusculum sp.]|nr:DNA methyltransferase [Methanocorpusculum sp.]
MISQNKIISSASELNNYLTDFHFDETSDKKTCVTETEIENIRVKKYINEFWTAKQRGASSLHEVSYRACFKPQLPRFFIDKLTSEGDTVYDPFGGRGTTIIEAALLGRRGISNDVNPLSEIFASPRISLPEIDEIEKRLDEINFDKSKTADIDLSMFYHSDTLGEIVSLREYLIERQKSGREDVTDKWIKMTATNRLTGHSSGFFSVYTLPPNQAVSPKRQMKINSDRNQIPAYRDVKKIIIKKSKQLLRNISDAERDNLNKFGKDGRFINSDAGSTSEIGNNTVQLTVTSPPFLDIVQYSSDNWLRCWFNNIDVSEIGKKITVSKTVEDWSNVMKNVFKELFRVTKKGGWVAFEVGEVRNKSVSLDDYVIPIGIKAGFSLFGVLVNSQKFTKTANIWGVSNNSCGTNSNRVVIFTKDV